MTLGERIKIARELKDFTQRSLSEATGIAEPTIRKYESGRLNPKYDTLQKIGAAMDIPIEFFLYDFSESKISTDEKRIAEISEEMSLPQIVIMRALMASMDDDNNLSAFQKEIYFANFLFDWRNVSQITEVVYKLNSKGQERLLQQALSMAESPEYGRTFKADGVDEEAQKRFEELFFEKFGDTLENQQELHDLIASIRKSRRTHGAMSKSKLK